MPDKASPIIKLIPINQVNVTSLYDQDHYLLEKLRKGCTESFNTLYEKYWERVYTDAFRRLKKHDQAQDITQDIFAGLWLKREELQIENLPAYLHISVRNRVLNLFEKERRYTPLEELLSNNILLQGERADAVVLRNEFLEAYKKLVDSLPTQRKKIFHLYYYEGISTDEIALRLMLSRKTVQNQLGRAFAFLRTGLAQLFIILLIICLCGK